MAATKTAGRKPAQPGPRTAPKPTAPKPAARTVERKPAPPARTASEANAEPVWISAAEAMAMLGRGVESLRRLGDAGHIRVHRPPGMWRRYYRPDVMKYTPAAALRPKPD